MSMDAREIIGTLRGIVARCDHASRSAGLAGVFPGPELRALSRIGDEAKAILRALGVDPDPDSPPWEPEPGPSAERKWSEVIPGDKVLAPNGTWYPVESVARIGNEIRAMLDGKIPTTRRADEMVKVERGDEGRAVDLFAAGGISLELIKSGADA